MAERKILWTLRAVQDKLAIYDYWINVTRSTSYAEKLEILFNKTIKLAAIFPLAGIPTENQNIRMTLVRHYKIFYYIKLDMIEIITIWDSRRNPSKLEIKR